MCRMIDALLGVDLEVDPLYYITDDIEELEANTIAADFLLTEDAYLYAPDADRSAESSTL